MVTLTLYQSPALPYELFFSCTSIDKKIKEKKIERKNKYGLGCFCQVMTS